MKYDRWNHVLPEEAHMPEGVPALVGLVLRARGLTDAQAMQEFLSAEPELLCDPFLLADMDKAVARIEAAIACGERIAVYGDYDVDGVTATCLMTDCLRNMGADVIDYIPGRMEEGYGLNREAVELLHARGVGLVVTVDCGITAVEEIAYAKTLGLDVIVTDHHACKDDLPDAVAVINPQRRDCGYPFSELAGVGVALKLACALGAHWGDYIDLAAIGTVADVMCLTGENRALVSLGLARLERDCRPGLRMLLREAGAEGKPVTSVTIGYIVAPRINAAGRMGRAEVALRLLEAGSEADGELLARELCQLNRERQGIESEIFDACVAELERDGAAARRCAVLAGTNWHQGVVGIVASRLAERFCCPVFMICLSGGKGKASCRSFGGVQLFEGLERCADLLEGFGGHALAAGFTILEENIPAFRERMELYIKETSDAGDMIPALEIDALLPDSRLLTISEVEGLALLEPHGAGNPRPVFELDDCRVQAAQDVGGGRHLKLKVRHGGTVLDAIFFSSGIQASALLPGDRVDLAFTPSINEYRGARTVQLQLCDLRSARVRAGVYTDLAKRLRAGQALTAREARSLLPTREEFAVVWRYLSRRVRVDEPAGRLVEQLGGTDYLRAMTCIEVLGERGLIEVAGKPELLHISVRPDPAKVDLEQSDIIKRLRAFAG